MYRGDWPADAPSDRIYSLMGLLPKHFDLQVDYLQPVGALYEEATVSFMQECRSLDLLLVAQPGARGLPSWVVDFGSAENHFSVRERWRWMKDCDNSALDAAGKAPLLVERVDKGAIRVKAYLVDSINCVCTGLEGRDAPDREVRAKLVQWQQVFMIIQILTRMTSGSVRPREVALSTSGSFKLAE